MIPQNCKTSWGEVYYYFLELLDNFFLVDGKTAKKDGIVTQN